MIGKGQDQIEAIFDCLSNYGKNYTFDHNHISIKILSKGEQYQNYEWQVSLKNTGTSFYLDITVFTEYKVSVHHPFLFSLIPGIVPKFMYNS